MKTLVNQVLVKDVQIKIYVHQEKRKKKILVRINSIRFFLAYSLYKVYQKTDIDVIKEHLKSVRNKVLILSGKGGVGKSTVCGQIAFALAAHFEVENKQIGALDIDICGPSLPQVFGVQGEQV